jgi:hypothetical protein
MFWARMPFDEGEGGSPVAGSTSPTSRLAQLAEGGRPDALDLEQIVVGGDPDHLGRVESGGPHRRLLVSIEHIERAGLVIGCERRAGGRRLLASRLRLDGRRLGRCRRLRAGSVVVDALDRLHPLQPGPVELRRRSLGRVDDVALAVGGVGPERGDQHLVTLPS